MLFNEKKGEKNKKKEEGRKEKLARITSDLDVLSFFFLFFFFVFVSFFSYGFTIAQTGMLLLEQRNLRSKI
jgi:hypothetical protein